MWIDIPAHRDNYVVVRRSHKPSRVLGRVNELVTTARYESGTTTEYGRGNTKAQPSKQMSRLAAGRSITYDLSGRWRCHVGYGSWPGRAGPRTGAIDPKETVAF